MLDNLVSTLAVEWIEIVVTLASEDSLYVSTLAVEWIEILVSQMGRG